MTERDRVNVRYLLFVIFLAVGGCFPSASYVSGLDCTTRLPFFHLPLRAQLEKFQTFAREEKYAAYLCGNQVIHPPALYLAEPFARDAPQVIPFLTERLSQAVDDLTVRDIVGLFREIQRQKRHDFRNDHALLTLVTDRINGMKDEQRRLITRQMLADIMR